MVDVYGKWAVIALYADGLERIADWVADALRATTDLAGIVRRGREAGARLSLVWGRKPPAELVVAEHGVRMTVDSELGQKTGLFLDHRENRRFVVVGRGATGAQPVLVHRGVLAYAARGGATDECRCGAALMDAARENFRLNGLDADAHDFVVADVFEHLEHARRKNITWDLVIPPTHRASRAANSIKSRHCVPT